MPSFEHMVAMNPNDNQGVRLLLGVPYHELGEHADALRWYRKTTDEAHVLFNWTPLCWEMYKRADAVLHIVQGSIEHLCLAPQLLCQSAPRYAFWHASNREEPEFAAEYVELYRHLWRREREALPFLRALWRHRARAYLDEFVALRTQLTGERDAARRRQLVDAEFRLVKTAVVRPLLGSMCATRMHALR